MSRLFEAGLTYAPIDTCSDDEIIAREILLAGTVELWITDTAFVRNRIEGHGGEMLNEDPNGQSLGL